MDPTAFSNVTFVSIASYFIELPNGGYAAVAGSTPSGWFHLTLVYHGNGKGASVYYDGVRRDKDTSGFGNANIRPSGSGVMVVGRQRYNYDGYYASVIIDELTLWDN